MGAPRGSTDSLSCRHPVDMLHDKTWRKPERVIASLKYSKRTHQRNPADVFYLLSSAQYSTYDQQGAKPGITTEGGP
jgi:hypothetical protein